MPADLDAAAEAIEAFLRALDLPTEGDPELVGTGMRVAKAFAEELLSGYAMDPREILASDTSTRAPGIVVLKHVETTAVCPHHLLPAHGTVTLGYLPGDRVAGLGALARLVQCRARRLVLQEDLGQTLADDLVALLGAKAAGCVVALEPTCVTARGARAHGAEARTLAFAGEATDAFRTEFLALAGFTA
ncbi:MAG: GTP cyclohydrolase [Myxococcales bacterium]|nr:GTP cyclohydrolase [Myxococcales bacterium]